MSTTSQRLGLKINDGSDPFLRTDFVQNYGTLDQYPGNWICTSTTRPNWGAGQAGMQITETDTRRNMLWTGTTWREMLYGPAIWFGSMRPQVEVPTSTMVTYVVGTFTVNRPGALYGISTTEHTLPCRGYIGATTRLMIDGNDANFDGPNQHGEYVQTQFPNTTTLGPGFWYQTVASQGVRNISAGTHSVGIRVTTQGSAGIQLKLTSIRAMAMFVNASDR
jgi:hypothetical protein